MKTVNDLLPLLEQLTGKAINPDKICSETLSIEVFNSRKGIGYSQFNEILLLVGIDRLSIDFFDFISSEGYNFEPKNSIKSFKSLEIGIEEYTKMALLFYGNIKFAFKALSRNDEVLEKRIYDYLPEDRDKYFKRHEPLKEIIDIAPSDAYYLGYYIEDELAKRIEKNPNDSEALLLESKRKEIVEIGKKNDVAYLASDHLDVYVATSMRKPHEFAMVNKFVKEISHDKTIKSLKLRIFNPTLAYCNNRIDKGLSEALMLKRAKCTIYLAQESETLGKDSELASTLAQGKVVIAYVPIGNKSYVDSLLSALSDFDKDVDEKEVIINQLRIFNPDLAWNDNLIQSYFKNKSAISIKELKDKLYDVVENYYEGRASGLKEKHPLGIQVNLKSGVANGVIVSRSVKDTIALVVDTVQNTLGFTVERNPTDRNGNVLKNYIYLKENRTDSIYRVKSGHDLLTTSFWNFYNQKQD
ncbi:MAG: hypothetical protein H6540_06245 [Bacteroidales bacterium]|nr:hypothetical protein [Bacteroidales bacterium]MCB9012772.1 hypothetical protein [Bacteroidales bacterium]